MPSAHRPPATCITNPIKLVWRFKTPVNSSSRQWSTDASDEQLKTVSHGNKEQTAPLNSYPCLDGRDATGIDQHASLNTITHRSGERRKLTGTDVEGVDPRTPGGTGYAGKPPAADHEGHGMPPNRAACLTPAPCEACG